MKSTMRVQLVSGDQKYRVLVAVGHLFFVVFAESLTDIRELAQSIDVKRVFLEGDIPGKEELAERFMSIGVKVDIKDRSW